MKEPAPRTGAESLAEEAYYAHTVLVPLGRPDTAIEMLRIAADMVHPTEGLVIALVIALGDMESANKLTENARQILNTFQVTAPDQHIELVTEMAISVSRGILDVARERNADVILLGLQSGAQGRVKLGTVVENVIATAPCGVLIYRSAMNTNFKRVLVPVNGSLPSTHAVELAVSFARQNDIPFQQAHTHHGYQYNPYHEVAINQYEAQLPNRLHLPKLMVSGPQPSAQILERLQPDDLLVLGFSQRTDFERRITNDLSNQLLNKSPGPVILISQIEWHSGFRGLIEHGIARLNPQLTLVEQNELIWSAQKSSNSTLDYIIMIVLSAGLATLGLLTNSVAVIIGAMLVAPLMTPLSSFSTGMATGILSLTRRASVSLFHGVALALLISIIMGLVLPFENPTSEMLARGSPNLLDGAIALVSGLVAAYATARKGIPAALAGVAIAAALMPPICTIGLGIALSDWSLAIGASLLFLANIAFIIASQYITFLWMGMHPKEDREGATLYTSRAWWFVLFFLTVITLAVFARLSSQAVDEAQVRERLQNEAFHGAMVVEYQVISALPLRVQLLLQSDHQIRPDEIEAAQALLDALYQQEVELTVAARQIVRLPEESVLIAGEILRAAFPTTMIGDISIQRGEQLVIHVELQAEIAPSVVALRSAQADLRAALGAEAQLRVIFQQVLSIETPAREIPAVVMP